MPTGKTKNLKDKDQPRRPSTDTESSDVSKKPSKRMSTKRKISELNGWSSATKANITKIGNETALYAWLHRRSASIISAKLNSTTLAAAILSAITSSGGVVSLMQVLLSANAIATIVLTALVVAVSSVVTIITIVQRTNEYNEKINKHRDAESKYEALGFKIQEQMQKPTKFRQNGEALFSWISYTFSNISQIEDIEDGALKIFGEKFDETVPGWDAPRKIIVADDSEYSSADNEKQDNEEFDIEKGITTKNSTKTTTETTETTETTINDKITNLDASKDTRDDTPDNTKDTRKDTEDKKDKNVKNKTGPEEIKSHKKSERRESLRNSKARDDLSNSEEIVINLESQSHLRSALEEMRSLGHIVASDVDFKKIRSDLKQRRDKMMASPGSMSRLKKLNLHDDATAKYLDYEIRRAEHAQ